MSLVIGAKIAGATVIVSDSRTVDKNGWVQGEASKIIAHGGWLVGSAGSVDDRYAYLYGVPEDADLGDPAHHVARCELLWDRNKRYRGADYTPDLTLLLAKDGLLLIGNMAGYLTPFATYAAIGSGYPLAALALQRSFAATLSIAEWLVRCHTIIHEVAVTDPQVSPPIRWATTDELVIHREEG